MIRATAGISLDQSPADTVVLDFDDRHRRRMAMTGTRGLEFLLDLENAVALRGGDALVLEDGRLIEVVAAPEPLLEIKGADPCTWCGSPGISATAICRRRSRARACASGATMSSRRW